MFNSTLVTPHVEYELEDAPEHVGRQMRQFRREDRDEALTVCPLVGSVSSRRGHFLYVCTCTCQITSGGIRTHNLGYCGRYRCAGAQERSAIAYFAIRNRLFQRAV